MRKKVILLILAAAGCVFLLAAALFDWNSINSYQALNTSSKQYVRARVVSVKSERLELAEEGRYVGEQELTVRILEGNQNGTEVSVDNFITQIHNVLVKQGSRVIVCADVPEGAAAYYTIYNYDRTVPLLLLAAAFAAAMLFVGSFKGLRALLGVTYSLFLILLFMVPAIYHGGSPLAAALVTILFSAGVSLLLLNGLSKKTLSAFLATFAGVCVTGVTFSAFAALLRLSGYNMDSAEELLTAGQATGLQIGGLLLAGVLISALGAVMDVAVSLSASLEELLHKNAALTRRELFISGMNIGKDMIGTMSNTLILAYAGTSLATMLCLTAYGYSARQLLSSDYLAIELAQGLCATIGLVLTVPVTSFTAAFLFTKSTGLPARHETAAARADTKTAL